MRFLLKINVEISFHQILFSVSAESIKVEDLEEEEEEAITTKKQSNKGNVSPMRRVKRKISG